MMRGAVSRRDGDASHPRATPEQIRKVRVLRAKIGADKTEALLHTSAVTIEKLMSGGRVKPEVFTRVIAALESVAGADQ